MQVVSNPLVSVIMPAYNAESTLKRAINSLVLQDYPFWECILIDDGSYDATRKIINEISDERFCSILFDQNKGKPYVRQYALNKISGKYCAFLDADDFYHPSKLGKQVKYMEDHDDLDLLSSGMGCYDSMKGLISVRGMNMEDIKSYVYVGYLDVPHAACMIRTEIAKTVRYDSDLKYGQDTDYFMKYLLGRKYFCLEEILYYYSEYDSVSLSKINLSYLFVIWRNLKWLRKYPLVSCFEVVKTIGKLLLVNFTWLIKGSNFVLSKRGRNPNGSEFKAFQDLLSKL